MNQVFDSILYPDEACPHPQDPSDANSISSQSSSGGAVKGQKNHGGVVGSPIPRRVSITHGLPNPSDDESLGHDDLNEDDDDEMARAMTTLMSRNDGSVNELGSVLIERAVLVDSIKWLSSHLPGCVLDDLSFHIASSLEGPQNQLKKKYRGNRKVEPADYEEYFDNLADTSASDFSAKRAFMESADFIPPHNRRSSNETIKRANLRDSLREIHVANSYFETPLVTRYESALLFVDISGFTQLSSLLDAESLSRTINSYFQMIVDIILASGGDILKFAGDGVFAEWRAVSDDEQKSSDEIRKPLSTDRWHGMDLKRCVNVAATCGAMVVAKCSNYPVVSFANQPFKGEQVATLNVHCGLGAGELAALHVGNADRREFLIIGHPIEQVSKSERLAALGELVGSPEAINLLSDVVHLDETILQASPGDKLVLASRDSRYFKFKMLKKTKSKKIKSPVRQKTVRHNDLVDYLCEGMDVHSLRYFQKLISLYVHPVVVMDELAATKKTCVLGSKSEQERHRAEAELRTVYTLFIKPQVAATLSGESEKDERLFKLLNDVMNLVCSVLDRFKGHLRQFIVDDKGVVLIATFGLRGSTCPNMLQERGLPAAMIIHNALLTDFGLQSKIGGTYGKAYCGVVGGVKRHEYAVLGKSVNLSARLMMSEVNPGIIVDDEVRLKTEETFHFRPLPAVFAKGYTSLVPIFEPLGTRKRKFERFFVGRSSEIDQILKTAQDIASSEVKQSKLILISGDAGSGKSSLLAQSTQLIRRNLAAKNKSVHVSISTSSEGDFLVPFSFYSSIFFGLTKQLFRRKTKDEDSHYTLRSFEHDDGSYSTMSTASSTNSVNAYVALFLQICTEIQAPTEFIEVVGHDVLGFPSLVERSHEKRKVDSLLNTIISFMAQLISHCTKAFDLTLLVLDNVHFMDEMSWKVVELIFENAPNFLIICASQPLTSFQLTVDENFWCSLQNIPDRFDELKLKPLSDLELTEMIAHVFQCPKDNVDEHFSRDIFMQSGGLPLYARELLGSMKQFSFVAVSESGKLGWKISPGTIDDSNNRSYSPFSNLNELIIHRLDNLEDSVRKTLQICAVLGDEFDVSDLLAVAETSSTYDRNATLNTLLEELQVATNEDILQEIEGHISDQTDRDLDDDCSQDRVETDFSLREAGTLSIRYRFTHIAWKNAILGMLLVSRKRDMHKNIALAFEARELVCKKTDYRSRLKLFSHWKESGERIKAANVAIDILAKFELFGFQNQSLTVINDAIGMWKNQNSTSATDDIAPDIINELSEPDVINLIQLLIFKGKTLANLHKSRASAKAYHYSLSILQSCPASQRMKDRSFAFPIFSGLFLLIKYGLEQAKGLIYEEELVRNFIIETKLHGDPVHYTRAIAMQADMYGRFSQWQRALDTVESMREVYNVEQHSNSISKYYGSDRCAQVISLSALWHIQTGNDEMAIKVCDDVVQNFMPKMEPRNVHNSIMILFPIMWVMKNKGRSLEIRQVFDQYVVQQFNRYYGANSYTPCLYLYQPILMLLELSGHEHDSAYNIPQEYIDFALDPSKFCFTDTMDLSMANAGRDASSIGAEVCMLLAKRVKDDKVRSDLVRWGFRLAERVFRLTEGKDGAVCFVISRLQLKPIYDSLADMLNTMDQNS